MKRILFIHHKISYGGANKMLSFMANSLVENGFNVSIVTYASSKLPELYLDRRIEVITSNNSKNSFLKRFQHIFLILSVVKKVRPNLIFTLMSTNSLYGYISKLIYGIPLLVSERGDPSKESGWFSKLKHFFMNKADYAIFQTEGAKSFFSDSLQKKSIIIPNPVLLNNYQSAVSWENKLNEISFVGRFELRQKRHDLMLLALREISIDFPEIKLNFYGDGEDVNYVRMLVKKLSLSNNVCFKGRVDNVLAEIDKNKYFVLASDYEGIPNSLIEAMSLNTLCISTDCDPGGAKLLINNEHNGFLVPKGDYFAIANVIKAMLNDDARAKDIAYNSSEINEIFSEDKIKNSFLNYMKSITEI